MTTARPTRLPWTIHVGRVGGLIGYAVVAVVAAPPHLRWATVALVLLSAASAVYGWRWSDDWRRRLVGVIGLAAGGLALFALDGQSAGWVAVFFAIASGLARLPRRVGAAFVAVAGTAIVALGLRGGTGSALGLAAGAAGFTILGLTLRGARDRADAAERLLASERAAREATAKAQVYAERQRLAREIHDILAHTLSAQVVQLEGARLLLARGAPAPAVQERIAQAQRLARDGLVETRRAVHSLRGDTRPMLAAVRALADEAGAELAVEGEERPVEPETGLVVERTVREALTNARKHAPGASVTVTVHYGQDGCAVEVCDSGAVDGRSPLADSGGGYGLAGMRERAELIGGELTAGPHPVASDGRGYRVWLTIPN